jgi:two-component system, sensor histidine kinase and response regulator
MPEQDIAKLQEEAQALISQLNDEASLALYVRSLRRLVNSEGNDLGKLAALKEEHQQMRTELDKFYEIVSYHLGSPLNGLKSLSAMLTQDAAKLEGAQAKPIAELSKHLDAQVVKLHDSMGNLITWADKCVKNYTFQRKPLDIGLMLGKVFEQFESQALRKRINLELSVTGELLAEGDDKMLQRALGNLLSNAIKFTQPEGQVKIEAQEQSHGTWICISDTGIGMGGAKLANIFNPSRKSTQRGTANELGLGLGLIVSKGLLELHGASLHIESEQGKGTKASFILLKPAKD